MGSLPEQVLAALGISNATVHTLVAALEGVVSLGVGAALPSPSPAAPSGKVPLLSLLHLCFTCGVVGDADLPPIWEEVARVKGCTEGLYNLN